MQKYSTRFMRKYAKNIHKKAIFAEICKSVPQICNLKRAEILVCKYMQNRQQRHEYVSLTKYASTKFICNMHKYASRTPQPKAGRRFAAALVLCLFGNSVPGHTTRAPPLQTQPAVRKGFELATFGIQFYVFANLDKISLTLLATVPRHWAREAGPGLARFRRG